MGVQVETIDGRHHSPELLSRRGFSSTVLQRERPAGAQIVGNPAAVVHGLLNTLASQARRRETNLDAFNPFSFHQRPAMSLAAPLTAASQRPKQYQKTPSSTSHVPTPDSTYDDEAIFDRFYDLDDDEAAHMMEDPIQTKTAMAAAVVVPVAVDGNTTSGPPSIPQKHNLRASRLLDAMTLGKLGTMLEPGHPAMTTPHDVYLSSEEDASSSADDFSDYEYESASEEFVEAEETPSTPDSPAASTPPRRRSHEVTARVVSVVFSGKPSVIELPKRIGTPVSSRSSDSDLAAARKRQSSIASSEKAHEDILATIPAPATEAALPEPIPRSSPQNSLASRSRRRSSVFSAILNSGKPKPPFLSIDPFANGSTYSLELPKEETEQQHNHHFHPKSPTALLKKTFGTIRRRSSRQALNSAIFDSPPPPSRSSTTPITAPSSPAKQQRPSVRPMSFYSSSSSTAESTLSETPTERTGTPPSPVTYNDIIKAAKRNASKVPPQMTMPPLNASTTDLMAPPPMPESPTQQKKGIMKLRRRSQKIVNGRLV